MRVVPRDDHGSWLIREPTTKVFTPNSLRQVKTLRESKFEGQFQIFFCNDVEDLMKHYFYDFTAEGVAEAYRRGSIRALESGFSTGSGGNTKEQLGRIAQSVIILFMQRVRSHGWPEFLGNIYRLKYRLG